MNDHPTDLLRPAEAAAILGVTRETLRRWSTSGRIPCIRPAGPLSWPHYRRADLTAAMTPKVQP